MSAAASQGRPGRIEVGWLLAAVGALLLLISLFLDWFEPGLTGWTVFEALDLVLAAAALTVLAVAARSLGLTTVGETAGTAAAAVAFVVVVSQLINRPPAATEADIEVGGWLALAGALLMLAGALMSRSGVSLSVVLEGSDQPEPVAGRTERDSSHSGATSSVAGATDQETAPMPPDNLR